MIRISDLHVEDNDESAKLACDISWESDEPNPFPENTLWFAVNKENRDFFSTRVYDPFLLVPYYMAMQYGQDLKIEGKVSKKLFFNLTNYVQRILLDFSDELKPVHLYVDGFDVTEQDGSLVGASISCGVDSLSTLYDRFEQETDPEYRVNAVFFFKSGQIGEFNSPYVDARYRALYLMNKSAADELGLPIYGVGTNLHSLFPHEIQQRVGYLVFWSCILSLQRKIRKYYISSSFSYEQVIRCHAHSQNFDMDEFCGSYLVSLIHTEGLELIYDGAQYTRAEKTENIAIWPIAQKHLNVCTIDKETGENCSCCSKCLRTMYALDFIGKLDLFENVFDLKKYRKLHFLYFCKLKAETQNSGLREFALDNIRLAKKQGVKLPPTIISVFIVKLISVIKKFVRLIMGDKRYAKLKSKVDGKEI